MLTAKGRIAAPTTEERRVYRLRANTCCRVTNVPLPVGDPVAQPGGPGARPPPKLGSQKNSWLRRWAKCTKLCMVWQPNILNNCYELSGGYAPQTTHQGLRPWTRLGDFHSPDSLCPLPPNPGYATVIQPVVVSFVQPVASCIHSFISLCLFKKSLNNW